MDEYSDFIVSNIDNLSKIELQEVLKIIHKSNSKITRNNNGVFINLSKMDNNILENIYNYIKFCKTSNDELKYHENIKSYLNNSNIDFLKQESVSKHNELHQNECKNQEIGNVAKTRMSSTMKFYILKKKLNRVNNTVDLTLRNELINDIRN